MPRCTVRIFFVSLLFSVSRSRSRSLSLCVCVCVCVCVFFSLSIFGRKKAVDLLHAHRGAVVPHHLSPHRRGVPRRLRPLLRVAPAFPSRRRPCERDGL